MVPRSNVRKKPRLKLMNDTIVYVSIADKIVLLFNPVMRCKRLKRRCYLRYSNTNRFKWESRVRLNSYNYILTTRLSIALQ